MPADGCFWRTGGSLEVHKTRRAKPEKVSGGREVTRSEAKERSRLCSGTGSEQ